MSEVIIRPAEERDVHEVAELDKLCFNVPWSEKSFRSEITENDRAIYLVADLDGKIIGYAGIWVILDEGHITNVAVHPEYRRQHLGTTIVDTLLKSAELNGVIAETLEVRRSNMGAIKLYSSFGFVQEGVRIGYYEDNNEDALIMWRYKEREIQDERR